MHNLEEELVSNALTSKVRFGGGKNRCLGIVYDNTKFRIESGGVDWEVPESQGAYPNFPADATDDEKKVIISDSILDEHDILVVEAMEELLKNQLIKVSPSMNINMYYVALEL